MGTTNNKGVAVVVTWDCRDMLCQSPKRLLSPKEVPCDVQLAYSDSADEIGDIVSADYNLPDLLYSSTNEYEYTGHTSKLHFYCIVPTNRVTHAIKSNDCLGETTIDESGIGWFQYSSRNDVPCYRQLEQMRHAYLAVKAAYTGFDVIFRAGSALRVATHTRVEPSLRTCALSKGGGYRRIARHSGRRKPSSVWLYGCVRHIK